MSPSPTTGAAAFDPIHLLADGLTLIYHESRHVRFLIKSGYLPATGWDRIVSLPKNRVEAWRELQTLRRIARCHSTAEEAVAAFEGRFGRSPADLERLYENAHWKDATAVGGHAWRSITRIVCELAAAVGRSDAQDIRRCCAGLIASRHNNGPLSKKIIDLDCAVGEPTHPFWQADLLVPRP